MIIRTETDEVTSYHVFKGLELGCILGGTDQFDAGRRGFEIAYPKVELEPPTFIGELTLHFVSKMAD